MIPTSAKSIYLPLYNTHIYWELASEQDILEMVQNFPP